MENNIETTIHTDAFKEKKAMSRTQNSMKSRITAKYLLRYPKNLWNRGRNCDKS